MKKIIALALVLTFSASAAFATTAAFDATNMTAATQTITSDDTNLGTLVFKLSKNVKLDYKSYSDYTGYAIATYHNKGTKTYGSSSGDSKIFENAATAVEAPAAPQGTNSANFTGWSAL